MILFLTKKIIISIGLMILSGFIYYYPTDWMGWLILGGSFYIIGRMDLDFKIKNILLFILLIHQLIALYYFFSYGVYVEGIDCTSFHATAQAIADLNGYSFGIDAVFFSNLLALFYKLDSSQLFGQELAVSAFMASCFIFMRIIRYYKCDQYLILSLLLYAFSPADLLWTSVILREPFELMLLMLSYESLICSKLTNFTLSIRLLYLGCSVSLLLLMCWLHRGFIPCFPVLFLMLLILPAKDDTNEKKALNLITPKKIKQYTFFIFSPIILLFIILLTENTSNKQLTENTSSKQLTESTSNKQLSLEQKHKIIYNDNSLTFSFLKKLLSGEIYKTIIVYRYGSLSNDSHFKLSDRLNTRTNYDRGDFIPDSLGQFIYMSLQSYAKYAFLPPLLVTDKWSFISLTLSLIYIVRSIFFCSMLAFCMILYKRKIRSPIILFFLYITISYMFSLGTLNYGTAMRHNMMTDWIIILLGTPLIYNFSSKLFKKFSFFCVPVRSGELT